MMRRLAALLLLLVLTACGVQAAGNDPPAPPPAQPAAEVAAAPSMAPAQIATVPGATPSLATATATVEPAPVLTRLTEPGCCVQPMWSPDGRMVLFIDRPDATAPTGIYGVSVEGGPVQLITERVAKTSPDGRYIVYLNESAQVVVEDLQTGEVWLIPSDRREPHFSPNSQRLVWTAETGSGAFSQRPSIVSVSEVNGQNAREVITVYGGGFVGWLDDDRMLVQGRIEESNGVLAEEALYAIDLLSGDMDQLAVSDRLRSVQPAPGGEWVFYAIAFDTDDPTRNGMWVVRADGSERHKLEVVGAAQWQDGSRLLIIPMEPGAPSHRVLRFDAETGEMEAITDPAQTPFRILSGDWQVSPTGEHIVFVSAEDLSLWVMTLPGADR